MGQVKFDTSQLEQPLEEGDVLKESASRKLIDAMGQVKFGTSQLEQSHEGDVVKGHASRELIEAMGQVKFDSLQLEQSDKGDVKECASQTHGPSGHPSDCL